MSQITVEFKDFREMVLFARELLKGGAAETQVPEPIKEAAPVSHPIAYGQQIAPHFPAANTGQAKAELEASVPQPQPVPTQPTETPTQQQAAVQTSTPSYTLEDLSGAAMQLMDKGMQTQLQQLLTGYGVETLPALPQEQFGNFATALRGMGAQI